MTIRAADFTVCDMNDDIRDLVRAMWAQLGPEDRPLPSIALAGAEDGRAALPSPYAVDDFAAATAALASCSIADLAGVRAGARAPSVTVDRRHAAVAFRSERYLERVGDALAPLWDPIAGDYRTADGWVRLHTNYPHHRAAALRALEVPEDRAAVTARLATMSAHEVEQRVVDAGGCAARMYTAEEWAAHPQGIAVAAEPLVARTETPVPPGASRQLPPSPAAPLSGIRVLDLTRVIAGPVCTRVLAAYGADVLRIDPPGFEESAVLLGDVTQGKRRATLDLRTIEGRARLLALIAEADLLVCGLRAGAMARLGLDVPELRQANPALGLVRLDAYGWTGPWRERRGFDSLVQMSTGIAARGREVAREAGDTSDSPAPLPAQALDHGTGYLLAAAACRMLIDRQERKVATEARLSLARVAHLLASLGDRHDARGPSIGAADAAPYREAVDSDLGPLLRVRVPGSVAGYVTGWSRPAGALGVDAPSFGFTSSG